MSVLDSGCRNSVRRELVYQKKSDMDNLPASSNIRITAGVPPYRCISSITYFPEGFKSAKKGVLSEIRWKSSRVRSTLTARAMAMRWSTALVLPPVKTMVMWC